MADIEGGIEVEVEVDVGVILRICHDTYTLHSG
jgi:hypothetical protein